MKRNDAKPARSFFNHRAEEKARIARSIGNPCTMNKRIGSGIPSMQQNLKLRFGVDEKRAGKYGIPGKYGAAVENMPAGAESCDFNL